MTREPLATPPDVRKARIVAGHTQAQAAAVLGVTRRTWAHWEAGTSPMRQAQLALYRLATVPAFEGPAAPAIVPRDRARVETSANPED